MYACLSSVFSGGSLQFQNLQVSKLPRWSRESRQKEVFIRALTPSANPPGKPIPPPTPPPHTLTHSHTHTPPTEIQKVCATLRAPGAQICSGGCCFSAVITLLSISTERKARGRKVKSRRRKKAWSVEGNNAEEKAQISGTSKTARGLRTGNKQAPFTLVVPQLDLGGLLVSRFAFLPLFLSVFSACRGEPR